MKKTTLITLSVLSLCLGASAATTITYWNFNSVPPDTSNSTGTLSPASGPGSAVPVGGLTSDFVNGSGSSDTAASDNTAWRTYNYPAASTANKTAGVQFTVDTTGYQDITFTLDQYLATSASKYWRVQYSTDNGATWVDKDVLARTSTGAWVNSFASISFAAIQGANNNPNFKVRMVSEWQSTATGSGVDNYVTVAGGGYFTGSSAGFQRVDMATFAGEVLSPNVAILADPTNQVVAVGQSASFTVTAHGGINPYVYQWRTNGVPIAGATQPTYLLATAQFSDACSYDCIVTNGYNSATSQVATLIVRTPASLVWTPISSGDWDSVTPNWLNTTPPNVAFTPGDNVRFDNSGTAAPTVNLTAGLNPNSVVVDNSDADYTFTTSSGGMLTNKMSLTKRGASNLILDTDNSYTGATTIEAGVLQVGAGAGRGSIGSGPVTNNSGLVFNRTGGTGINGPLAGTGGLTNSGTGSVSLSGTNTFSGPLVVNAGAIFLSGPQARGNITNFILNASTGQFSKLGIGGGIILGNDAKVSLLGTTASPDPDRRCVIEGTSGTNALNGTVTFEGNGTVQIIASVGRLNVNSSLNSPGFTGQLLLRGAADGRFAGAVTLNAISVSKTDSGTWTFYSPGNSWPLTTLANGVLRLGANGALPASATLTIGAAGSSTFTMIFDMAGFNQQVAVLNEVAGGTRIIANSSTSSDSVLTVMGVSTFSGTIADSTAGGTRKVGLTVNGGPLALYGTNTYSGPTTVMAGGLALVTDGSIANSATIDLAAGTVLDAASRTDQTLTLASGQTLKGNGAFNVKGNLVSQGTIELKISKTAGVVSNDRVNVIPNDSAIGGQITYGGTLKLILSGEALNASDNLKLFDAATGYLGSFIIQPAAPGVGFAWDTSTLASDGTLHIVPVLTITSTTITATDVVLSGVSGTPFAAYHVAASADVAVPLGSWPIVQTGSFDGSGNFAVSIPIVPGAPKMFYKLVP